MTTLMPDDFKIYTFDKPPRSITGARPDHRCWFGNNNRCACGKHREPAFATGFSATLTDKQRLSIEL
jgi:hypothetical protein